MRRAIALGALALVLGACGPAGREPAATGHEDEELRHATQHYGDLVGKMDHAAIAALFDKDGVLAAEGSRPVRGPEAIEKYLESFSKVQVLSESLTVSTVNFRGSNGHVTGTYQQSVRLPEGNVANVHGTFAADWIRGSDQVWRLRRMASFPDKERKGP